MADVVPEGAIPENDSQPQAVPPGAIPEDAFNEQTYGTPLETAKTAAEQLASGVTLGASKALETQGIPALGIPAITTPEAIAGRETANPITSTLFNTAGTGALIAGTGGLGFLGEGAGVAARIGATALEGGLIGGANQATDDWSQNKPLDAQKIMASSGLGLLLGVGGGVLGEGVAAARGKNAIAEVPASVADQAAEASQAVADAKGPPVKLPEGIEPQSFQDIVDRVAEAKASGKSVAPPSQAALDEAVAGTPQDEFPVTLLQRDSLGSAEKSNIYETGKITPGRLGETLTDYEALQKNEQLGHLDNAIQQIAPGSELSEDAYDGGKKAIDAFTEQYQNEKQALAPVFEEIKSSSFNGNILPDAVQKMSQAVPGVASMFEIAPDAANAGDISIRPYKTSWGIDKATYNAVKEVVNSLQGEDSNLQTLWNVRKGLDQHVDVLTQGQAPREIRALKAALMDQMQESTDNPAIRDAFRRYAVNEQQRQVIEKSFGASVGTPEFGAISKVKPEKVLNNIFNDSATVQAAKNILPADQFNAMVADWMNVTRNSPKISDPVKNGFSSNKWATFLANKKPSLDIAFQDNPGLLTQMQHYTTKMRILPDQVSINPSNTGPTAARIFDTLKDVHSVGDLFALLPKKVASEISSQIQIRELNQILSQRAVQNAQQSSLKARVNSVSDNIDSHIKTLFSSSASQARKSQDE